MAALTWSSFAGPLSHLISMVYRIAPTKGAREWFFGQMAGLAVRWWRGWLWDDDGGGDKQALLEGCGKTRKIRGCTTASMYEQTTRPHWLAGLNTAGAPVETLLVGYSLHLCEHSETPTPPGPLEGMAD
jgi:hypothetical protein